MIKKSTKIKYLPPLIKKISIRFTHLDRRNQGNKFYLDQEALLQAHWLDGSWST